MIITKEEVRDELDSLESELIEAWVEYNELEDDDLTIDDINLDPPQLGNNSFYNFYENEILAYQSLFSFYNQMDEYMYSGEDVEDSIRDGIEIEPEYMYNYIDWEQYCRDYLMGCESLYHPNGTCFYRL